MPIYLLLYNDKYSHSKRMYCKAMRAAYILELIQNHKNSHNFSKFYTKSLTEYFLVNRALLGHIF